MWLYLCYSIRPANICIITEVVWLIYWRSVYIWLWRNINLIIFLIHVLSCTVRIEAPEIGLLVYYYRIWEPCARLPSSLHRVSPCRFCSGCRKSSISFPRAAVSIPIEWRMWERIFYLSFRCIPQSRPFPFRREPTHTHTHTHTRSNISWIAHCSIQMGYVFSGPRTMGSFSTRISGSLHGGKKSRTWWSWRINIIILDKREGGRTHAILLTRLHPHSLLH